MIALYIRVSSEEQKKHGLSSEDQKRRLIQYCDEHGHRHYRIYDDSGHSGGKSYKRRPALMELINDCKSGKVTMIMFTSYDRFFRSMENYYLVLHEIGNIPIVSIDERIDSGTAEGNMTINFYLMLAQFERDKAIIRTKKSIEHRKSKGWIVGSVPYGYKIENHKAVKDPDQNVQLVVSTVFGTYLETFSVRKCQKEAMELGKSMNKAVIYDMLRNPTYAGNAYGSECERYIDEETHRRIVKSLDDRTREAKNPCRTYIFSGLFRCKNCGRVMAGNPDHNGGKVYKRYRCSGHTNNGDCPGVSIAETALEKYMLDHIEQFIEWRTDEIKLVRKGKAEAEVRIDRLNAYIGRIKNLYEIGDMDFAEYKAKRDDAKHEIDMLRAGLDDREPPTIPSNWRDAYDALDDDHRRAFWAKVVHHGFISREGIEVVLY